jgi:hypothetical protein
MGGAFTCCKGIVAFSQTETGQRLPQRKVSRIIAAAVKSLKDKLFQLR